MWKKMLSYFSFVLFLRRNQLSVIECVVWNSLLLLFFFLMWRIQTDKNAAKYMTVRKHGHARLFRGKTGIFVGILFILDWSWKNFNFMKIKHSNSIQKGLNTMAILQEIVLRCCCCCCQRCQYRKKRTNFVQSIFSHSSRLYFFILSNPFSTSCTGKPLL